MYRLLILFALCCSTVAAATHVITSAGGGSFSGADWNNACAGLAGACDPTTGMVRGDLYYVASGAYTSTNQAFSIADSGALTIELRGATTADHGPATGWNAGTMDVNVAPAVFSPNIAFVNSATGNNTGIWRFHTSNWIVNGNNCVANKIRQLGQGIRLNDAVTSNTQASLSVGITTDLTEPVNLTVLCVEEVGAGLSVGNGEAVSVSTIKCGSNGLTVTATFAAATRFIAPNPAINQAGSQIAVTGVTGTGFNTAHAVVLTNPTASSLTYQSSGCTPNATSTGGSVDGAYVWGNPGISTNIAGALVFRYMSIHEFGSPIHMTSGYASLLNEYNYIARWTSNSTLHSDAYSWNSGASTNSIIRYSYFLDGEGSAVLAPLNGAQVSNLSIYGNVFAQTASNPYQRTGYGDGIFGCINFQAGSTCTNIQFYNNTIANILDGFKTSIMALAPVSTSTWKVENNLWYNSDPAAMTPGSAIEDYNTLLNTTMVGGSTFTGAHDFNTTSGSPDPFVADTVASPTIDNFKLFGETLAPHLNDGLSTHAALSGNDIDYALLARGIDGTWERGAFEFSTSIISGIGGSGIISGAGTIKNP